MDEVPDTALDLARLVDELTVLDQRRVDIGESLVHLEYLYSQMGARQQADAARKASRRSTSDESTNSQTACEPEKGLHTTTDRAHGHSCTTHRTDRFGCELCGRNLMEKITKRLWNWASILDENTREQALRSSQMPFVRPHLALMPDAHLGAGATVGSVIPTEGAIMPAAVGVDIGCGMIAVKTQFNARDLQGRDLSVLRHSIEHSVPLSAGVYNKTLSDTAQIRIAELETMAGDRLAFYDKFKNNWRFQLGTLGSGNHFIEVTLDESDGVWLFLHSGSRGIGNKLAQHHIKIAKDLCERWYINLPDPDLAYLVEKTPEFDSYITDLNWAQHFALLNREEMMDRVVKDFAHFMGDGKPAIIDEVERINCHHNFTQKEFHMGRGVWLSRKGAIKADEGTPAHPRFDGDGELRRRREGKRTVVQVQPPRRGSGVRT